MSTRDRERVFEQALVEAVNKTMAASNDISDVHRLTAKALLGMTGMLVANRAVSREQLERGIELHQDMLRQSIVHFYDRKQAGVELMEEPVLQ